MTALRRVFAWLFSGHLPMLLARLLLGGVYIWFGYNKVERPVEFLKVLREYNMFPLSPPHLMNLTVIGLPWVEIVCGVLLIVGAWLRAAGSLLFVLTVAFTIAVTMRAFEEMGVQGLSLCDVSFDCGCGTGTVFFCSKFAENVGLTVMSAIVALSGSRLLSVEGLVRRPGSSATA